MQRLLHACKHSNCTLVANAKSLTQSISIRPSGLFLMGMISMMLLKKIWSRMKLRRAPKYFFLQRH